MTHKKLLVALKRCERKLATAKFLKTIKKIISVPDRITKKCQFKNNKIIIYLYNIFGMNAPGFKKSLEPLDRTLKDFRRNISMREMMISFQNQKM